MAVLDTQPNILRPDDVYELLVDLHRGCDEGESLRRYARLVMLLANHIGDVEVIRDAVRRAR